MTCSCARPRYEIVRQPQLNLQVPGGDCFRACVAMVLKLPNEELPNFYWDSPEATWWEDFQSWLAVRNLMAVEYKLLPESVMPFVPGVPCILVGPSLRFPGVEHCVVGVTSTRGFHYLHDPHASEKYFDGPPTSFLFFVALRPDLLVKA
jgi:hypothetical protein